MSSRREEQLLAQSAKLPLLAHTWSLQAALWPLSLDAEEAEFSPFGGTQPFPSEACHLPWHCREVGLTPGSSLGYWGISLLPGQLFSPFLPCRNSSISSGFWKTKTKKEMMPGAAPPGSRKKKCWVLIGTERKIQSEEIEIYKHLNVLSARDMHM